MVAPVIAAAGISTVGNLLGGLLGRKSSGDAADANVKAQREFAQNGIQWKVEDAKKAGIHPLYALGSNTHSFTPTYVGDTSLPQAFANVGQDIGRAMMANADQETRQGVAKAAAEVHKLQVEKLGLENDLLRQDLMTKQAQIGPPAPSLTRDGFKLGPGGTLPLWSTDVVTVEPSKITSPRSDDSSIEAGPPGPAYKEYDLGPVLGKWKLPGEQVTEALEDTGAAKYAVIAAGNREKIPQALRDFIANSPPSMVWAIGNKPEWVKRLEVKEGYMLPFNKDGVEYWAPWKKALVELASGSPNALGAAARAAAAAFDYRPGRVPAEADNVWQRRGSATYRDSRPRQGELPDRVWRR